MVKEAKGRLFLRKDGKYLIYVSTDLVADNILPFRVRLFIPIGVGFKLGDEKFTFRKMEKKLSDSFFSSLRLSEALKYYLFLDLRLNIFP